MAQTTDKKARASDIITPKGTRKHKSRTCSSASPRRCMNASPRPAQWHADKNERVAQTHGKAPRASHSLPSHPHRHLFKDARKCAHSMRVACACDHLRTRMRALKNRATHQKCDYCQDNFVRAPMSEMTPVRAS